MAMRGGGLGGVTDASVGQNHNQAFCQENRQGLVLVKLEELDIQQLTKEMKYLITSLTYLAWPQNGKS